MTDFVRDLRYIAKDGFSIKSDAPKWITVTLPVYQAQVRERKLTPGQEAYAKSNHVSYVAPTYDEPEKPKAASRAGIYRGTHQCLQCGGFGRVTITDSGGHSTTDFCPACRGQGQVSN